MSEVERIADQARRTFEGDAWHGPSVWKIVSDITAEQAARRLVAGAHTVWEIVLHMATWDSVVRRRIEGEVIPDLPPEKDWPPVHDRSEAAWKNTLAELRQANEQLRETILRMTDRRLEETVLGQNYSVYVMLHGNIQHDLYHAGQIALLKKGF